MMLTAAASAQDATWLANPGSAYLGVASNWSPAVVPTGTAFFGASSVTTLFPDTNQTIGGLTLLANAGAYELVPQLGTLTINGAGISILGGSLSIVSRLGQFVFSNSSTAGTSILSNYDRPMYFLNNSTAGNATVYISGQVGRVWFQNNASAGNATFVNYGGFRAHSSIIFQDNSTALNATISNSGSVFFGGSSSAANASIENRLFLTFADNSTAGNATITSISGAIVNFNGAASGGTARFILTGAGAYVNLNHLTSAGTTFGSLEGDGYVSLGDRRLSIGSNGRSTAFAGVITDSVGAGGSLEKIGAGTLTLTGASTFTGGTLITAGTLRLGDGGPTGSIIGNVTNNAVLAFNRSNTYAFDGVISGTGALQQIGSGTTILTAANGYTGATTVSAGTLLVNGSIAPSSGVTVAAGATLGGTGIVPTTIVNGTLSPGASVGTLTVVGNLSFGSGAVYLAEVQGGGTDRVAVTGTATLAGTLRLVSLGGSISFGTRYSLLSAAAGRTGVFAVDDRLGPALRPTVSYDATSVFLTLEAGTLAPILPTASANQASIAAGLDRAVLAGGNANPFLPLYTLPSAVLPQALGQLSGEVHAGAQGLGTLVSGQFLSTMLDPAAVGRSPEANPALAYAPDLLGALPAVAAATQAADLASAAPFDVRRFALWGAAFGSDGRVAGNGADGATRRSERSSGIAAGVDMRLLPGTTFGFALAGGGAHATLGNGLGTSSAEVFQAGAYGMTRVAGIDLSAALAYGRLEIDTTRAIPVLGLAAVNGSTDADVWSGRIEASYQLRFAGLSVAPLAAFQIQRVATAGFVETAAGVAPAAGLTIAGQTSTTSRSELGARVEGRIAFGGVAATAFARLAWAHYFERDAAITASFTGLPGSAFTVTGARPDRDAALISTGLDLRLTPQLTFGARFDGEFSENVSRYAGTARLRYAF
jgi:autotransporter-associated beta strand protein